MIEFLKMKLLKNYPLSRIVELDFFDPNLSEENKEQFESKIRKYNPPIKGLEINRKLSKIEVNSTHTYIALTLRIPHYMTKSIDDILEEVKKNFIKFYNSTN